MVEGKKLGRGFGVVLAISGFAIFLINAIDYLGGFLGLSLDIKLPSSGIGVVFLVVGWIQILNTQQETHKTPWQDSAGGDRNEGV
jgi:hypothetical protein